MRFLIVPPSSQTYDAFCACYLLATVGPASPCRPVKSYENFWESSAELAEAGKVVSALARGLYCCLSRSVSCFFCAFSIQEEHTANIALGVVARLQTGLPAVAP